MLCSTIGFFIFPSSLMLTLNISVQLFSIMVSTVQDFFQVCAIVVSTAVNIRSVPVFTTPQSCPGIDARPSDFFKLITWLMARSKAFSSFFKRSTIIGDTTQDFCPTFYHHGCYVWKSVCHIPIHMCVGMCWELWYCAPRTPRRLELSGRPLFHVWFSGGSPGLDLPCGSESHRPPHDFKQSANSLVVTTFGPLPPWLVKTYGMGISHLCRSSSGFWWAC